MFGFSFAELIVVLLVCLIFIRPQDLPEIAHFAGKVIFRSKKFFNDAKAYLKSVESEVGIEQLKQEINRGIAEEKAKVEEDLTVIVDIYGNEHKVPKISEVREDMTKEEIEAEIARLNIENSAKIRSEKDDQINSNQKLGQL